MSSRKGVGKRFVASNSSLKGKDVCEASGPTVDQLGHGVTDISLDSGNDGEWQVCAKKSKNRAGRSAAKTCGMQNPNPKAWEHPDMVQKTPSNGGSGNVPGNSCPTRGADLGNARPQPSNRGFENSYKAPTHAIRPPLEDGWNWSSRAGSTQFTESEEYGSNSNPGNVEDDNNDDTDGADDIDYDFASDESDDYDTDSSQKSHDTRKKSKCFRKFFEEDLSIEALNEKGHEWHCPACRGGPGAIYWYSLQPLITHAKTKGGKRMKLHRELAELLDEELHRKGISVIPAGEAFGIWNGPAEEDHEIIWPPMVLIMNTRLKKDDDNNNKWIGMGNKELRDCFSSYRVVVKHSYGPEGHRGMSVLIFETSATGYIEAETLHKHFVKQGTDRDAWMRCPEWFYPGRKRQLYGFMATKGDLDSFNRHSHGKSKLKFEIRSHQEMVVHPARQMNEDNQNLIWLETKVAKGQRYSKALEELSSKATEKLHKAKEENNLLRQRTKMQYEQNKEEMDFQEQFFKDQIKIIREARCAEEDSFELLQQKEREKVEQSNSNTTSAQDHKRRAKEVAKFIKIQDQEMEDFVVGREDLIKAFEDEKLALKRRYWEEEVELEKKFDLKLKGLMENYKPRHLEEDTE